MGSRGKVGVVAIVAAAVVTSSASAQGTEQAPLTGDALVEQLKGAGALGDLPTRKDALEGGSKDSKQTVKQIGELGLPSFLERSFFGNVAVLVAIKQAEDALKAKQQNALDSMVVEGMGKLGSQQSAMLAAQAQQQAALQQIVSFLGGKGGDGGTGGLLFGTGGAGGAGGSGGGVFGSGGSGGSGSGGVAGGGAGGAGGNAGTGGTGSEAIPGPTGPQGEQGPQGPPGPAAGGPWARVSDGDPPALIAGSGVVSVAPGPIESRVAARAADDWNVRVTFDRSVANCAATATTEGTIPVIATATPSGSSVSVRMWAYDGEPVGVPFSLTLACP